MSEKTMYFGQWLRQRRRSLDLTQTELASLVGCSTVNIRKLEIGERRPSRQMACLLADKLGIADEERPAFVRFARTDEMIEMFRHPLFTEPPNGTPISKSDEFITPESLFPADFPGWVEVMSDETPLLLSDRLLMARWHAAPVDSPRRELLNDGHRELCTIYTAGRIIGGINGTFHQEITHLIKMPNYQPCVVANMAVLFNIVTDAGHIKGSCTGYTNRKDEASNTYADLHGKICAVTDAYADLFLSEVRYKSEIIMAPYGIKAHGALIIVPG
jgi:transcriptional regulator with XRE-family HTH domain